MFKTKLENLINEYGVKKEKLIELINSNRVTFAKKLKDNTFSEEEKNIIKSHYKGLI